MRMNEEKDEFLFFGWLREKRVCLYLFLKDDWLATWVG